MDPVARQPLKRKGIREMDILAPKKQPRPSDGHPYMCDLRIVFLGKNVSENSRVRNLILGIDLHEIEEPTSSQQHTVFPISGTVKNRHVMFINSHHLLNPNISDHQITQTVRECVNLSAPGPHAFIIILQSNDFTEEDTRRVKYVLKKFGEEANKRTIVLTTDTHTGSVKKNTAIHDLIKECGGEHLQFNERKPEWQSEIFKTVDKILKRHKEEYITCEIYEDVIGTSVDVEQSRSDHSFRSDEEHEESSHHKDYGKPKGRSEASIADQSPERNRPDMSLNVSGKQKLNLVLCGSDTALKVSLSKLLRGKSIKPSHHRESSEECVKKEEKIHGRMISLVELPTLSRLSEEEVTHQTLRCVSLCHPGVHVFLFIVPDAPLTDEDKAEIEKIQKIFYSKEHLILLFTTELTADGFALDLVKSFPSSQRLISLCGGQYRVMGLKQPENSRQIPKLLDYIESMKTEPYSLQTYVKAQENRVRRELEEQHKKELSEMESKMKELEKIQSEGLECNADDLKRLRMVLIGRTGSGKSATGNTILRRDEFESELSADSVTTVCEKGVGEVDGRSVAVVDTPGIFDTTVTNDHVVEEIMKCVSLSSPGPHVFVIVLSLGRFTKEEMDTIDLIKKIFGHKAARFSIVLFTGGDKLKKPIKQFVSESKNAELQKLITDCGNRLLVFNNTDNQDRTQVIQLLKMIEELKNTNEGQYFTNSMFEEAEMSIKKRMEEILKEREREIQEQREELQAKYEMEMENMMKRLEEEKQRAEEERIQREHEFRKKEENLIKDFEEKEKTEQKKREIENQKQSEEENQQRAEYDQKIEEMKREIENQKSQYEKQQKERKEEDRKREEKYRQDQEKMKNEQERIEELRMKQEEEIKKIQSEEQKRKKEEEEERQRWIRKIKENDRKDTQEEIKRQQREWEDEKKRQMREREEDEKKRKERYEEQLREKQEELEKMRKRFEREKDEERQKAEKERQKQKIEREGKEREYRRKKTEMKRHYEHLERERKEEWESRKREDDERQEEERNTWKKKIDDLKGEQEEEKKKREEEEKERQAREEKERDEMKQKHEKEIKDIKKKHKDEARKQAEEVSDLRERKDELKLMLEEQQQHYELLENIYHHLNHEKIEEVDNLKMEIENLKKKWCTLM